MTTSERMCVYTVLTKGFEDLLDQPVAEQSNVDFICFSDDPSIISNTWMIRPLDLMFTPDPARSSRLAKLCAHRVLPEYDISLYIDNSVRLRRVPEAIVDELLPADVGFAALSHPYRDSIEDDLKAIGHKVEAPWVLEEQIVHYRIAHPETLKLRPITGGFLIRRHNRPDVIQAMERWFNHVLRYSRRDQLSAQVAFHEVGFVPHIIDLDIRDNGYCTWPIRANRDRTASGALPRIPQLDKARSEARLARDSADELAAILQLKESEIDILQRRVQASSTAGEEAHERVDLLEASNS